MYTLDTPSAQVQEIAYSLDGGYTFTRYSGNPVINVNSNSFRDPEVIWYAVRDASGAIVPTAEDMYVLTVSVSPDAPLGGSTIQCFPGSFNGTHSTPVDDAMRFVDIAQDNYGSWISSFSPRRCLQPGPRWGRAQQLQRRRTYLGRLALYFEMNVTGL